MLCHYDTIPDGNEGDHHTTPENASIVTVDPNVDEKGEDLLVDSNNGSTSGWNVMEDENGNPVPGVHLPLHDSTPVACGAGYYCWFCDNEYYWWRLCVQQGS
jgi:hypothetical protein